MSGPRVVLVGLLAAAAVVLFVALGRTARRRLAAATRARRVTAATFSRHATAATLSRRGMAVTGTRRGTVVTRAVAGRARPAPAVATDRAAGDAPAGAPAGAIRGRGVMLATGVLAGVAAAVLTGGWQGLPVGCVVSVVAYRLLSRMEPADVRRERRAAATDLPLAADLLGAALRAGSPVDRAVEAVAHAVGGPLGDRLARVARSLRLGAEPAEAWTYLATVPGADRLVTAAVRGSASGAALAGALTRLADDLRAQRTVSAEAAARRAGVLIVLPLGLCFLPAFILAGLVPVIVAVLGDVL